jgi:hypothetical protein
MKKIVRNVLLRNAYTSGDLAVNDGALTLAGTPLRILWNKLKGYKVEVYTAGSFGRIAINLNSITPANNGPHRLTVRNSNRAALQTELVLVVYGDATATVAEIATELNRQVVEQSGPNSIFKWVSFSGNIITIDLEDTSYSTPSLDTDIVGATTVVTAPVKPVGDVDASALAGYVPTADYDKYTFHEEGTVRDGNNDVPVIYEDIVYVDDSLTAFATDVDDVVDMQGVTTVGGVNEYLKVPTL